MSKSKPVAKKPAKKDAEQVLEELDDEIAKMLQQHNKKILNKKYNYVARTHSVKEIKEVNLFALFFGFLSVLLLDHCLPYFFLLLCCC
jgi:hypothetical protein